MEQRVRFVVKIYWLELILAFLERQSFKCSEHGNFHIRRRFRVHEGGATHFLSSRALFTLRSRGWSQPVLRSFIELPSIFLNPVIFDSYPRNFVSETCEIGPHVESLIFAQNPFAPPHKSPFSVGQFKVSIINQLIHPNWSEMWKLADLYKDPP